MQNTKAGYRPDIDGLRAVAVLAVILYHFKVALLSGGFVGVDIFFVISGYLITKVIVDRKETTRFDFADFYLRRVRRLIPALLVTIASSYVAAFVLFSPSDFKPMSGSTVYALTGISNIYFWAESGYFDAASTLKPLLHTWSLGVEIQFYLVWPVVLLLLTRFTKTPFVAVLVLILIGVVASVQYLKHDASGAFFLTPFRMHEFLFGGLVVFAERYSLNRLIANMAYLLGLALVGYSIFVFKSDTLLFPGLAALVPAAGAALMILGGRSSVFARPLSSWPAVKIGEISYSLYLVHWPLFVFISYVLIDQISTPVRFSLIGSTGLLALALYHFVEKPFRHQRESRMSGAEFSLVTLLASVMVIVPAASSWAQDGWGWRVPAEIREMVKIDERSASIYVFEVIKSLNQREGFDTASKKQKILVIGDSQAGDLLNILNEQGYLANYDVVSRLVDSACATPGLDKAKEEDFYTRVNPIVIKDTAYVKRCQDSLERANNHALISGADKIFIAMYWRDFAEPYYLEAINKITAQTNADVYVFGRKDLLKDSAFIVSGFGRLAGLSYYASRYRSPETDRINQPLANLQNVRYVDMMKATCPSADRCLVLDGNNKPAFFNATHLSKEGAKLYGPSVRSLVDDATKNVVAEKVSAAKQ
ncbi:acyltransferase family protein [Pseudomonas alliivorans]|nr:acyltransferase family protein [Pseudomonas alliivorans]MEE4718110.1 acyltransferase family protein [Pseudomonas alliivorans]MEE4723172.1 acyltransferase family protein [Pseudomonas alliivorans]MEE4758953.1 acyltransferase family protein [Pseudomonas alliivorans]MEE4763498.1 acyltransferase family protein [Pseudomonas alliivorans]